MIKKRIDRIRFSFFPKDINIGKFGHLYLLIKFTFWLLLIHLNYKCKSYFPFLFILFSVTWCCHFSFRPRISFQCGSLLHTTSKHSRRRRRRCAERPAGEERCNTPQNCDEPAGYARVPSDMRGYLLSPVWMDRLCIVRRKNKYYFNNFIASSLVITLENVPFKAAKNAF